MKTITLGELAAKIGAELHGDPDVVVYSVASTSDAQEGQITFLSNSKYRKHLAESKASAVIVMADDLPYCTTPALVMADPYLGYAKVARVLDISPKSAEGIAPSAYISATAIFGDDVAIGHNAVIEDDVELGDNVQIGAGCYLGKGVKIGAGTKLWQNVTLYHGVQLGNDCVLHAGAVIGADGFGYANDNGRWVKIPQVGSVIIGDEVEIGANTAIDRGAIGNTLIGDGTIIDNLCQIGHNVTIGRNTAIAGATVIAGSTEIGNHCTIGGAAVFNGHIKIVDGAIISGMAMVMRPVTEPGMYTSGIPLQPNREWRKTAARLLKIEEMHQRLKAVEKQLTKDE